MNCKYKSTSVLLRSPRLHLNEPLKRLSDISKISVSPKEVSTARIFCNVEDVFKKSPKGKTKENVDLTTSLASPSLTLNSRQHRSYEDSYHQDLNNSISSKLPSIIDNIHELTLGPNATIQEQEQTIDEIPYQSNRSIVQEKSLPPCQDPEVTSEESNLDEEIRMYLKHEKLERSNTDISKKLSDAMIQFNCKQKEEYLGKKKSIEQAVISDQLRGQSQSVVEIPVNCDSLTLLEKNKAARMSILDTLNEVKSKIFKQKEAERAERLKKEKEKQEQMMAICKLVTESFNKFKSKEETFLSNLSLCGDVARFQKEGQDLISFNKKVCTELSTLVTKCKQSSVTRDDVQHVSLLMSKSEECFDRLSKIHETIQSDLSKREEKLAREREMAKATPVLTSPGVQSTSSGTKLNEDEDSGPLGNIIDASSLQFYKATSDYYTSVENSLHNMMQDGDLKSFRFQCMKAFNIPINAISGLDGQHMLEQYNRLVSVLRGDRVVGSGSSMKRVSQHPLGIQFCKYSMAKKFVAQVDVKPRVLFAYASVIVELWREFPDFGNLLVGEFHKQCPYLIPVFWPQLQGQSNEDYYKSLGYQYIDGQVEKQDLFLKRMTAMVQLYAAITITPTRSSGSHPHNLQFSWRWLAAMLNLDPQPDISATLLYSYIKIAGNKMAATYRNQFFKLIRLIQTQYLRKIKQVTPEDQSQQSIAILEELINTIVKTNNVPPPEGQLPIKFW
ncbi:hypothetical protein M8J77_011976 [Diaphorina citri]|nr:hypothetical protein M8J77_011976 [Diaphorina citri]